MQNRIYTKRKMFCRNFKTVTAHCCYRDEV